MLQARLTDVLQSWGRIDDTMVRKAVSLHRRVGRRIGELLVELGFCTRWDVVAALAAQAGLKPVDLNQVVASRDAVALVPRRIAERHAIVPLRLGGDSLDALAIAVAAPVSLEVLDAIRAVSRRRVVPFVADERLLAAALARAYGEERFHHAIDLEVDEDEVLELDTTPLAECLQGA